MEHSNEEREEKRSNKRKKWTIIGVVAAVAVVAGVGFFVWHEQPSFCNAICHQPMDSYVEGYYAKDQRLLASVHEGADVTCLECHEPTLSEQIVEGITWATGDYEVPLEQRSFDDGFCLNSACHDASRASLAQATDHLKYNPHADYHEVLACGDCHKVHEQSVLECSQCHSDAYVPEGWASYGN